MAGQLGGGRTETAVPTGRHKFCRVIHSCSWSRMDGLACLRKVNQVSWRCRPQPTIKRRYKSHLSMHMNSTRGSATPMAATYCCTHYTMNRANRQSNSCVCCWCVVAVPPESPLKIAASYFLELRPSTCSLRVCSVTPTAILHFQPWGKTRKCKI